MNYEQMVNAVYETGYSFIYYKDFDFKLLDNISYKYRAGRSKGETESYNDIVLMGDTETSKKVSDKVDHNHVVAWTISGRAYRQNVFTVYGHRPDSMCKFINNFHSRLKGDFTIIYFHNLPYDWVFLRRFLMEQFGTPDKQLNVKPHYPIYIKFANGLILKDSLILSQRSLEKWAVDLNVEHQKATGKWDYEKIRNQNEKFSNNELEYIEHDTLAGVECIDKLRVALNKHIYSMPYTATGIPREETRKRGSKNRARDRFKKMVGDYDLQLKLEYAFHGGYCHGNRHYINRTIKKDEAGVIQCFDFASSYPYCMIAEKFPIEKFHRYGAATVEDVIEFSDTYACLFKLIMKKPRLKNDFYSMPALQFSKCVKSVNAVLDNGRILCAGYIEIYITEQDLLVIVDQYDYELAACIDVELSRKDYLPQWFRDYVFECFHDKTQLKGGDPVLYSLAKAKLNSLYGMCVQKPVKDEIIEDYATGLNSYAGNNPQEDYDKYIEKRNSILPYQWGVWVTAYAFRHLFLLGECISKTGIWLYSDTDSCYAVGWDHEKVNAYNEECKRKIKQSGYDCVTFNDREYWLGVAESDGDKDLYTEFRIQGAKRYCGRCVEDGKLHITVAGVPKKKGALCLNDDIENFDTGFVFSGSITGKKTHTYFFNDVYVDENGNITGDSIDLSQCDYLLDSVAIPDWESIFSEEIEVQDYEER